MNDIKAELLSIAKAAILALKPSVQDEQALVTYATESAKTLLAAKFEKDPAKKEDLLKEAMAWQDAISLLIARYEVKAGAARERTVEALFSAALRLAIAAIA